MTTKDQAKRDEEKRPARKPAELTKPIEGAAEFVRGGFYVGRVVETREDGTMVVALRPEARFRRTAEGVSYVRQVEKGMEPSTVKIGTVETGVREMTVVRPEASEWVVVQFKVGVKVRDRIGQSLEEWP